MPSALLLSAAMPPRAFFLDAIRNVGARVQRALESNGALGGWIEPPANVLYVE